MTGDELKTIKEVSDSTVYQAEGVKRVLNSEPGMKEPHKEILIEVLIGLDITREKLTGLL